MHLGIVHDDPPEENGGIGFAAVRSTVHGPHGWKSHEGPRKVLILPHGDVIPEFDIESFEELFEDEKEELMSQLERPAGLGHSGEYEFPGAEFANFYTGSVPLAKFDFVILKEYSGKVFEGNKWVKVYKSKPDAQWVLDHIGTFDTIHLSFLIQYLTREIHKCKSAITRAEDIIGGLQPSGFTLEPNHVLDSIRASIHHHRNH